MTLPIESLYTEEIYKIPSRPVIVITTPWSALKEEEKSQLIKITDALKQRLNPLLGIEGFTVISADALDLSTWQEKPAKLIYFGAGIKGLNNYEVIEAGSTKMVLSEGLTELIANDAARTKLWQALRQLFSS